MTALTFRDNPISRSEKSSNFCEMEHLCHSKTGKISLSNHLSIVPMPRRRCTMWAFFGATSLVLMIFILWCQFTGALLGSLSNATCSRFTVQFDYDNVDVSESAEFDKKGIPKIFHQTYKTEYLPIEYMPLVTKCRQLNPDWRYILWRDQDILTFVRAHFPQYLAKYTGFKINLQRADMIRYMVLYHYGGVYTDMDVECIRPFFPGLDSSENVVLLDQERREHAHILYGREFTAMNSAMAAPPRHPFFMEVLRTIDSVDEDVSSIGWSTGPHLVTSVYKEWIKGEKFARHPVRLLSPEVFSPMTDNYDFQRMCSNKELAQGNLETPEQVKWFKAGCQLIASKSWSSDVTNAGTIGRHQFLHLGYNWSKYRLAVSIHCNVTALHPSVYYYTT